MNADFIKSVAKTLPPAMSIVNDIAGLNLPEQLGVFDDDTKKKGTKAPSTSA